MRQRIDLVLLPLLMMMPISGPAAAKGAETPVSAGFGLPAYFAVTFDGTPGDYLLVPGDVEIRSEGRTADGWVHRDYVASFEIRGRVVGANAPEPGALLGRGRFAVLKTHRPAGGEGGYFEGSLEVDGGRDPFDSPGKSGTFSGPFPTEGFDALPWGRVTWNASRDFDLTGVDDVSWGAVKNRFR